MLAVLFDRYTLAGRRTMPKDKGCTYRTKDAHRRTKDTPRRTKDGAQQDKGRKGRGVLFLMLLVIFSRSHTSAAGCDENMLAFCLSW